MAYIFSARLFLPTVLIVTLSGCGISLIPKTAEDYANTLTPKLCISYLAHNSSNIHQKGREAALAARGEDCTKYVDAAMKLRASWDAQDAASNAAYMRSLGNMMMKQNAPAPAAAPSGIKTHTYMLNGRMFTCTTSLGVTNCM